jgi:hypothetical protein
MTVGAIVAQLRIDMTNFREGLGKANSLLEQYSGSALRASGILTGFGAAVAGGIALATKASAEFEAEMRNVNSILKESEPSFRALSEAVLALSGKVGQAPEVLARGLYDIASSGFSGAEGLKVLEASAVAATAGLTDTRSVPKLIRAPQCPQSGVTDARHAQGGRTWIAVSGVPEPSQQPDTRSRD